MPPWRASDDSRGRRDDTGAAALEFIVAGLVLLVPLVYLVLALGEIQQQALGVASGARHIARAVADAPDAQAADARAEAVLQATAAEYGLDAGELSVVLSCRPAAGACPRAGATVIVTLATRVALPLVPPAFGLDRVASVPIEASAAQRVSRFWGAS